MKTKTANLYNKVAEFWSGNTDSSFFGETYWLANPIINSRFHSKASGDRDYANWVNFSIQHYLGDRCPVDNILSIGCGSGALERHLAALKSAHRIDGIDIAAARIEIAEQEAMSAGYAETISYHNCNVETAPLPQPQYDAIYFNSSLHHMSNLDGILKKCADCLSPQGLLFVNEYIGPNRFDFTEHEKTIISAVFELIPDRYRISHSDIDRGEVRTRVGFPNPKQVAEVDPSEAIHSEDIEKAIAKHFRIRELNHTGGTLLQFMLDGIAANFSEDDPESLKILEMIFSIEDVLIECGSLNPHFAFIVASH